MMYPIPTILNRLYKPFALTLLLIVMGFTQVVNAQPYIYSTPPVNNDTVLLCSPGNLTATFGIGNWQNNQTYSWTFSGGTPSSANGRGPHSVTFSSSGYAEVLIIQNNSLPQVRRVWVIVGNPVNATFFPPQTQFCSTDQPITLTGQSPAGGTFVGPGVTGNSFDPALAGGGYHQIGYVVQDGGCTDTAWRTFRVYATPTAALNVNATLSTFFGQQVYSRCLPLTSTFVFTNPDPDSTYTSFTLNFGDGSPPLTGSTFPSPYVLHTYPGTGFYTVTLTMTNALGCSRTNVMRIFHGSNPSVGLNIQGNNVKCLPRDGSGVTFSFPITNTANNSDGTIYVVQINDGSPPQVYFHPPPDSIVHTFYENSCGYNTVNFVDAFQVQITALTPCQPPSVATVEPIYISDPPTADFTAPDQLCIGDVAQIHDRSFGSINALNGCDSSTIVIWDISPSTYNLQSGSLGNDLGSSNPGNWIPGSSDLTVEFTKPGIYTITQYAGNLAGCEPDTMVRTICVDSLPEIDFGFNSDTLCLGSLDTLTLWYMDTLANFCDTTQLDWSIWPRNGFTQIGGDGDSSISIIFNRSRSFTITLEATNHCGTVTQDLTIYVLDPPDISLPNDYVQCGLGTVDFGQNPFQVSNSGDLTSINWQIIPDTGWVYTGGTDSTSAEPIIDFTSHGVYTIIVTASNDCGTVTDTMTLTFAPEPTINPLTDTTICDGGDVTKFLSGFGGTPPYTYRYGIVGGGGNGTSTGPTLNITNITSTTTYWVRLTDVNGCSDQTQFTVTVSNITADAGGDIDLCLGDTAVLNGSISGGIPPYQFYWSPGSMLSDSTILNPTYTGSNLNQVFTLYVVDSMGCTDQDQVRIHFDTVNNVDAGPDITLCINDDPYDLRNQGTSGGNWTGPGVTGATFDPSVTGIGSFTLFYDDQNGTGCPFVDSMVVTVIAAPVADFSLSANGCSPLTVNAYDSSSVGGTYQWFVNGSMVSTSQNPTFNFVNNGSQDSVIAITLIVDAGTGCTDTITRNVTVYPNPVVNFNLPAVLCDADSVVLNATSNIAGTNFQWLVSSPAVVIAYDTSTSPVFTFPVNQSGVDSNYTITLIGTSANGCIDTITKVLTVPSSPIADFTLPAAQCSPASINPVDASTGSGLTYSWSVSPAAVITNGNTASPTIDFPVSTNDSVVYAVTLSITNSNGCTDEIVRNYTVYPRPTANFAAVGTDSCGVANVTFNNLSDPNQSGMNRSSMTFFWDFGNGQTSTDSVPSMVFTNTGNVDSTYQVTLIATNAFGCTDTFMDVVVVHPLPVFQFTASQTNGCAPLIIDSNNVSVNTAGTANSAYIWQIFATDGTLISQDTGLGNLNYVISNFGDSVIVRLIVESAYGCVNDTSEILFYSTNDLLVDFTLVPDTGCSPLTVNVIDSIPAGITQEWYVNGVLYHTGSGPVFNFVNNSATQDSIITITFIGVSANGCSDTIDRTVVVTPVPQAGFTLPNIVCPGDTIQANNTSISTGGQTIQWFASSPSVWISDNSIANPLFVFADNQSGFDSTYTISLVISSNGCSDSVAQNITISSRPVANFTMPAADCGPVSTSPIDASSGNNLQYSWSVSGSASITGANTASPTIDFPVSTMDSVVYTVSLLLTDSVTGCIDTLSIPYTVYPLPYANFDILGTDSCGVANITFGNLSDPNQAGMDRSSMTFFWDFGNGQTSTDSVPTMVFTNTGVVDSTYQVTLIATNAFGCTDTFVDVVVVHPLPVSQFTASQVSNCAPFVIDSSIVSVSTPGTANSAYYWEILSTGGALIAQDTGIANLNYTLSNAGDSVIVRLIVESPYGCVNDTSEILFHAINDVVANFALTPDTACSPMAVTVFDSTTAGANQEWYLNGVLFHTGTNPVFNFTNTSVSQDSVITIKLVATSANGCVDSLERTVVVLPNPQAGFTIPSILCPGDTIQANDTSIAGAGYTIQWFASSASVWISDNTIPNPLFAFPDNQSGFDSTYTISLVISYNGCSDSVAQNVTVTSRPVANFTLDPDTACSPMAVTVFDSTTAGANQEWYVNGVLFHTGTNPVFNFTNTSVSQDSVITIKLVATSANGCVDSLERTVVVLPNPQAGFTMPNAVCPGDTIQANDTSIASPGYTIQWYASSPGVWISDNSIANPLFVFPDNQSGFDSTYTISLVISNNGCSDSVAQNITISSRPVASFTMPAADCGPVSTSPVNASSGNNLAYSWSVSGSAIIMGANTATPVIDFPVSTMDSVVYTVSLVLTDSATGCMDTLSIPYTVYPLPTAAFTPSVVDSCGPVSITFGNSSSPNQSGMDRSSMTFFWDFGNGQTSTDSVPTVVFTNTGTADSTYIVTLIATNAFGCSDTISDTITIHPAPIAAYTAALNSACAPFTIDSTVINTQVYPFINDQYLWEVVTNGVVVAQFTGINAINYTIVNSDDTVQIRLIVTSPFGCANDTATQTFYTYPNPVANFTAVPDSGCSPLNVTVVDSSTIGATQEWYVNGSLYLTGTNPVFNFTNQSNADSTIAITLVVTSAGGCTDSITRNVIVHPQPVADFTIPAINCGSDTIYPVNNSVYPATGTTFQWVALSSSITILNDTSANPAIVLPPNYTGFDSTYSVKLIVTTSGGCVDSITRSFVVKPQPTAAFSVPPYSCAPASFGPINTSTGSNLTYQWNVSPAITITNPASRNPVFNFPLNNDSVIYSIRLLITDSVTGCQDVAFGTFKTYPAPTANFTFATPDSCGPFNVNFINLSVPNLIGMDRSDMTFFWDLGNGQTSTDSTPTATYVNNGLKDTTYTITLIATNAFGCSDTIVRQIIVHPDARATASAYPVTGCAPFVIDTTNFSFVDYPYANAWYQWQIIDANNGNILASYNRIDSLNYVIQNPGDSVYLRMIAHSAYGCNDDTLDILYYSSGDEPLGILASPNSGCHPLIVQFSDTAQGFVQWQWYIDGQAASVLKNPTFTFTNTSFTQDSVYIVSLVAWDANGCNDSVATTVRVHAHRNVNWYVVPSCIGDSIQFNNTTPLKDSIASWYWDFGDGQFDSAVAPVHSYGQAGQYIVTLTATDIYGCAYSHTDTIISYPRPVANFNFTTACGNDSACVNSAIALLDSSYAVAAGGQIVQWQWDINNDGTIDYTSQNPSHTFTTTGYHQVALIVTSNFGCTDTIVKDIFIFAPPVAFFTIDNLADCGPYVPVVSDSSTGIISNYNWVVYSLDGSGNRVVIYTSSSTNPNPLPSLTAQWGADTTYYVELTVDNCCGTSVHTEPITLRALPVPGLVATATSGCSPLGITFDLDTLTYGDPDYLIMSYGDGQVDTLYNWSQVTHIFLNTSSQDTTYTVSLTAANDCGDSTVTMNILVQPSTIQAGMTVNPVNGCAPLAVEIIDMSIGSTNTSWCLDYNSATGSCNMPIFSGDTINYTYSNAGTYVIAQFVSNSCSVDTAFSTIVVYPVPQAMFAHTGNTCSGNSIIFTNQSIGDTISSYQWNFGDGNTSTAISPTHLYAGPGTYVVCLEVTSNHGCYSIYCDTVQVYDIPDIEFSTENACLNEQPVSFYDSSSVQQGTFISTLWKFGDGNTSISANPAHTYASAGTYQVTLIHETSNGCIDSATRTVTIYPLPTTDFDANRASAKDCGGPQLYDFDNLSVGASGYYWDFDYNGQRGVYTSTQMDASHLYTTPGVYDVMLVAYNAYGCNDTAFKTVYVRPMPDANFYGDPRVGCAPLFVTFYDMSVYNFPGPGGIVSRTWDFGDGTTITTADSIVTYTYMDPGTYNVLLIVETDGGCIDSIMLMDYIQVLQTPVANFSYKSITSNKVQFENLSTFTDQSTNYYWDFGDGTFSIEKHPIHTYNVDLFENDHSFEVCLITSNALGCGDTICMTVELRGYLLHVPNAFAPERIGVGEASIFLPKGHSLLEYHLFIYDEWGNLIFESTALDENGSPSEHWDGRHMVNGADLPMGSYVWKILATFNDGTLWPGKQYKNGIRKSFGTVTLIR